MSRLNRVSRIASVVIHQRLDELVEHFGLNLSQLPAPARWAWRLSPLKLLKPSDTSPPRRLRLALEQLGPVAIKFGQILSTRRDLLPADLADELANLQDKVPPFPSAEARRLVEAALGRRIEDVFADFDTTPLASASVAQVHAARLMQGDEVVVKVIRPNVHAIIEEDLKLLHTIARTLEQMSRDARRLHLVAVVRDYQQTIMGELNLRNEGANTSRLRQNFADSALLYVPRVHWEATRENVLVLERIYGVPIARVDELKRRGTNMKKLAERGVEIFFTQVFEHNFFHADMHPGNIFVDVRDPENPRYIAIDCAIIGTLSSDDQNYLARNLLAFFNQDYQEVARLHLESGWVPAGTNVVEFENVIREVCEPIFAKPLKDISFGHFLVELFQTARAFNMEIQPQLVLLQKTLLNIEGLGRQLYPELDLWTTAKPFMERWMREKVGPLAALRQFFEQTPELIELVPRIPMLLTRAVRQLDRFDAMAAGQQDTLTRLTASMERQNRRARANRFIGAVFLVVAAGMLWGPVSASLGAGGDLTATAGLLAALIGSFLIART